MFHVFKTPEERRVYGVSAFLEWQYCRKKPGTSLKKIVSVNGLKHWEGDSLYVHPDDMEAFVSQYGNLLGNGIYNNQKTGPVDIYGINYYSPEAVKEIRAAIEKAKPEDFSLVREWLKNADLYNGFYILGL